MSFGDLKAESMLNQIAFETRGNEEFVNRGQAVLKKAATVGFYEGSCRPTPQLPNHKIIVCKLHNFFPLSTVNLKMVLIFFP